MHDRGMSEAAARSIVERLRAKGFEALYAGGCVRDHLLGLTPHDYDVATNARPEQVEALFSRTVPVGVQFGVIIVLEAGAEIQVATFRGDGAYHDGRHPESVTYTDAEGDSLRRDFTVNGLFFDPIEEKVLDFVGGRQDLEARLLRAIGNPDERFAEDKLRLLRAVRFATTLGFEIDPETWKEILVWVPEIHAVSAERIREELCKILLSPNRLRGFDLLHESGLLTQIIPEMEALKGCETLLSRFNHIYVEISFFPLYEGQVLAAELIEWLAARGFHVSAAGNPSYGKDRRIVQMDMLFTRAA